MTDFLDISLKFLSAQLPSTELSACPLIPIGVFTMLLDKTHSTMGTRRAKCSWQYADGSLSRLTIDKHCLAQHLMEGLRPIHAYSGALLQSTAYLAFRTKSWSCSHMDERRPSMRANS
jgi:hypothetical protein